jgi:phosphoglycolate phosphatase
VSEPAEIRAVLFDVDSTILVTGGAGGAAWQRAFAELYGVDANVAERTDAGMTDPEIAAIVFREAVGREGSAEERARAIGAYLKHLPDTVRESSGYRLMPGIEALLERLIDAGLLLGLVTGNVEAAAHIKLSRAGLNRFFSSGGYGSDSADRTEVTRAALRRAELVSGGSLEPRACIAVGDTPRDVRAGHGAGLRVVGVATGKYSVEELREAGADWALETVERGFPL